MKLGDKIIKLRKQFGWSQEELAEKMNVSRQSVSKWESAMSIPDLNKIIKLAEIFSVSTDFLLKDEMEIMEHVDEDHEADVVKVGIDEVRTYMEAKAKVDSVISKGVLLFITSAMPLFLLLGLSEAPESQLSENVAIAMGLTILLLMVAVGVALAIGSDKHKRHYELFEEGAFELQYGVESIIKEELQAFMSPYVRRLSICISMFILGPLTIILGGIFDAPQSLMMFLLALLLVIIGVGVMFLIPAASKKGVYDRILRTGDYSPTKRKEVKRSEKIGSFYWPLVVTIYLAWSFLTMNWGITWIVWPVAAVAFPALIAFIGLFEKE